MTLAAAQTKVTGAQANRELYRKMQTENEAKALLLSQQVVSLEEAQAFLIQVAQDTQNHLRYHIQDIVQMALDVCFPNEYLFQVEFEIKNGRTVAELFFLKSGVRVNPLDSAGGGVVDVASFALRIAAWALSTTRPTIVLDEPFRFLSKDLQPKAGEILSALSSKLSLQFIMVTHNPALVDSADRVFEVSMVDKKTKVVTR